MRFLIVNAAQVLSFQGPDRPRAGEEMRKVGLYRDGAVLVEDGKIAAVGLRDVVMRHPGADAARIVDAGGRILLPGFVDSHSHPVFAEPRLEDFAMRIGGKSYAEIGAAGGGILSSVRKVRLATEGQLVERLVDWCLRFIECGTTTLEAKSGYGLDLESELKMLRVVRRASELTALELVPTFLGAHALPAELRERPADYVKRVCEDMIPAVAKEGLARFVDVFCEKGYFSEEDAGKVLAAGAGAGLKAKVHAEQLTRSGGARVAAKHNAVSADHLDRAEADDLEALRASGTVATLVPAANYFLATAYPAARRIIDSGVPVALATDFNPGSAPCWNMQFVLSLACTQLRLFPEEALVAATINGAWALGLGKTHGSIEVGKQADLVLLDAADYREAAYYFGGNLASWVMKKGKIVHSTSHMTPFD
ncbi:MAG: imidazolonepropionase [Elusimicrobia bacterium]|nr:imidazolonepropionase [Elusimicrobiota bacterium]